jgi:hypothetical protein
MMVEKVTQVIGKLALAGPDSESCIGRGFKAKKI